MEVELNRIKSQLKGTIATLSSVRDKLVKQVDRSESHEHAFLLADNVIEDIKESIGNIDTIVQLLKEDAIQNGEDAVRKPIP